VTDKDFN